MLESIDNLLQVWMKELSNSSLHSHETTVALNNMEKLLFIKNRIIHEFEDEDECPENEYEDE